MEGERLPNAADAGGESRRRNLEPRVEAILGAERKPRDQKAMAQGRQLWRVMVLRARRHLMAESWLEPGGGKDWKLTLAGRKAAGRAAAKSAAAE